MFDPIVHGFELPCVEPVHAAAAAIPHGDDPNAAEHAEVFGVTPDLTKKIPAGQVVKQLAPIVGGGGGGRPDFAEAGGKDASKIKDLLAASRTLVEKMLSSA